MSGPFVDPEVGSDDWVEDLIEAAGRCSPGVWKTWGMQLLADPVGGSDLDKAVPVAVTYQEVDGRPRTGDLEWFRHTQPTFLVSLLEELLRLRAEVRSMP